MKNRGVESFEGRSSVHDRILQSVQNYYFASFNRGSKLFATIEVFGLLSYRSRSIVIIMMVRKKRVARAVQADVAKNHFFFLSIHDSFEIPSKISKFFCLHS